MKQQLRVRLWLAEAQSDNNNAEASAYVFDSDLDVNEKTNRTIAATMYSVNSLVDMIQRQPTPVETFDILVKAFDIRNDIIGAGQEDFERLMIFLDAAIERYIAEA